MKIAIVGSRDFTNYEAMKKAFDIVKEQYPVSEILTGCAMGADSLAVQLANERDYKLTVFKADWNRYGKGAGPVRNTDLVNKSDIVMVFWNGISRGSKDVIRKAIMANKILVCVSSENTPVFSMN